MRELCWIEGQGLVEVEVLVHGGHGVAGEARALVITPDGTPRRVRESDLVSR